MAPGRAGGVALRRACLAAAAVPAGAAGPQDPRPPRPSRRRQASDVRAT
jgi:hypothetical protein